MKKQITISAFISGRKKVYVKQLADHESGKKIAVTTLDKNEAMSFDSDKAAAKQILTLHNPLDRHYVVEEITVTKKGARTIESDLK